MDKMPERSEKVVSQKKGNYEYVCCSMIVIKEQETKNKLDSHAGPQIPRAWLHNSQVQGASIIVFHVNFKPEVDNYIPLARGIIKLRALQTG